MILVSLIHDQSFVFGILTWFYPSGTTTKKGLQKRCFQGVGALEKISYGQNSFLWGGTAVGRTATTGSRLNTAAGARHHAALTSRATVLNNRLPANQPSGTKNDYLAQPVPTAKLKAVEQDRRHEANK